MRSEGWLSCRFYSCPLQPPIPSATIGKLSCDLFTAIILFDVWEDILGVLSQGSMELCAPA